MLPPKAAQPANKSDTRSSMIEEVEHTSGDDKEIRDDSEMKCDDGENLETNAEVKESRTTADYTSPALRELKEMKNKAMYRLQKWASKQRQDEVTISLFQALITAPVADAI